MSALSTSPSFITPVPLPCVRSRAVLVGSKDALSNAAHRQTPFRPGHVSPRRSARPAAGDGARSHDVYCSVTPRRPPVTTFPTATSTSTSTVTSATISTTTTMSPSSAQSISDSPATTRLESPSSPLLLDGSKEVPGLDGWRYTGPAIESGIVTPVVVYLALTATQSLEVAPINDFVTKLNGLTQPTTTTTISSYNENIVETTLNHDHIRIFSPTLPFHSDVDMAANEAVFHQWADTYLSGGDIASSFARHVDGAVTMLANAPFTDRTAGVHIVGLSRGALFAGLVAARNQHVRSLTAFAPVVSLLTLSEFEENEGVMQNQRILDKISAMTLTADDVVKQLVHNRVDVRCYMGNVDVRVGTRHAFDFAHALAISANEQGVRSPPHEFIMYPSVGKHGHGTPPHVFEAGAKYILSQIEAKRLLTASNN